MYLLKWINDNDGDFFTTANDMEEASKLAAEAYYSGQIDGDDNVQVFEAAMTAEERDEYAEPVAEWSASDFRK